MAELLATLLTLLSTQPMEFDMKGSKLIDWLCYFPLVAGVLASFYILDIFSLSHNSAAAAGTATAGGAILVGASAGAFVLAHSLKHHWNSLVRLLSSCAAFLFGSIAGGATGFYGYSFFLTG